MPSSDERMPRLALLNAAAAALHLAVALTILVVRPVLDAPVRLSAPGVDAGAFAAVDVPLAAAVVALLSAVVRLVASLPPLRERHQAAVARGRHGLRWLEYSQAAGITMVLVGLLNGVAEAGAVVLLYAISAGAVLLLWLQDRSSVPGHRGMAPFSAGAAIGLVPWGVVALYQVAGLVGGEPVPALVRTMTLVLLVLSALQWLVVWLHHEGHARAGRPASSERAFVVLSIAHSIALLVLVLPLR